MNLSPQIRQSSAYYYSKILKSEKHVINNISLIAFCIFFAIRKENRNAPVTINEIARAFKSIGHRVNPRLILRDGIRYKNHLCQDTTPKRSEDYLVRLIDQVIKHEELKARLEKKESRLSKEDYQKELSNMSNEVLRRLSDVKRGGRNPFILTGAVIYLAIKFTRTPVYGKK